MPNPKVRTLTIGGVTYDLQDNISGYITGITSSDVTTALGFTPYNATNPNGYTSNTGTITSVKTTAGTHTTINVSSGAANFNVPTKTSHLTNDSNYITTQYIENKTDYEIPVSRVGEIVVGETAIGTDSTNFPTSKAVVDYVDERVVQEMDAIDVGVISVNGKTGAVTLSASDVGAITQSEFYSEIDDLWIPTYTSQLTNDSGFITASDVSTNETDPTVPAWAKASTKPTYTASEVGALPSNTVIPEDKVFIAIRGTTTYNDVLTAINANKVVFCRDGSDTKWRYATSGSNVIYFVNIVGFDGAQNLHSIKYLRLSSSNEWWSGDWTIPYQTSDLTNNSGFITISDIPTNVSSFTNDSGYLTASDIASVMTYKGTKANYAALPASGNTTGDVWHLTDTGAEWAWDGSAWQELGTAIDLSDYLTTSDIAAWAKASTKPTYTAAEVGALPDTTTIPSKTSDLTNDSGFLTSYTETDPTVPSWAKQSSKPSYGLTEISGTDDLRAIEALTGTSGLLKKTAANTWTLDTNTYLTSYTETDPTVPSWAKASTKPTYTAAEVGALPDSTAIPSKVSDLTNDSGFITSYTETDPIFSASAAAGITATDISNWNNKSDTDEKLKVTVTNTSGVYYPVLSTDVTTAETKKYDEFFNFCRINGTSAYLGIGKLNTALGQIRLYTAELGGKYGIITPGTLSETRTYTLPNKTGTIALTSDIPTVPAKVSDLTNDSGFISSYTETDPVFSASAAAGITSTDISNWNNMVPISNGSMFINNDGNNNGFIVEYGETNIIQVTYNQTNQNNETHIHYVVTPVANGDAANKKYVDDSISAISIPTKTSDLTNDSNFTAKSTITATLTTTWSSKTQTVSVTGVTASNTVIITPAPASYNAYCEYGVYCSAQSSGTLTFTCDEVPTSSLTVNVLILN